ncbi:imm11 family protein [Chitinophagaceae bacterium LWZ2-11]
MNYYIFKPAINTFETGTAYPQIQKMSLGYDYKATNSVHALSRANQSLPNFSPNLDYFVVNKQAKLSDLLSVSVIRGGFLISNKLKEILEKHNLPEHQFYSAKIQFKTKFYDYYWLHIISDLTDVVDYSNSTFFIYHNYLHNLGYIKILSKQDFDIKKRKLKQDNEGKTVTIWSEAIFFNKTFENQLDLFAVSLFDNDFYITETLKNVIMNEKITGVEIQISNKIHS